MMKTIRYKLLLAAMVLSPSVFAINGKTLYQYIAYEAYFWPKGAPANAAEYQNRELNGLSRVPFDTLVFTPMPGFGMAAGLLKSAPYHSRQPEEKSKWMSQWRNAMPELAKAGVDPIAETVKWCRANKREAVCALPVNILGTHSRRPTEKNGPRSWYGYLWPDFKSKNIKCLMQPDKDGRNPDFGPAITVDYAQPAVRAKMVEVATEIASKYNIDGLMIDFMTVPSLFKSVAEGATAAPKEAALITEMMTQIKSAVKAAEKRLGHSVSFGARVPDSMGYCKDIGIDLQGWFDTKLLDFVAIGGMFQLNRWNVVGDAAIKAGIPYYISLTQSGITVGNDSGYYGDDERMPRNSWMTCAARIADGILCKATGALFTDGQHWDICLNRWAVTPFDVKINRTKDKRYFVNYTNDHIAGDYLKDGMKYRTVPSLISNYAFDLSKGIAKYSISVWDDFASLKAEGIVPKVTLITEVEIPSGVETIVTFNGKPCKCFKKRSGTQMYALLPEQVKMGPNEVSIKTTGKNKRGSTAKLGNIAVEVVFPKPEQKK